MFLKSNSITPNTNHVKELVIDLTSENLPELAVHKMKIFLSYYNKCVANQKVD